MNWYKKALLDEKKLEQYGGSRVVECKIFGNYQLCLVEGFLPMFEGTPVKYQISINTLDTDAANISDQKKKFDFKFNAGSFRDMWSVKSTIQNWVNKYKIIAVASHNAQKSSKYFNVLNFILKGTGVKISSDEFMGQPITVLSKS